MVSSDNSVTLKPTGDHMPLIGLGTWQLPKDKTANCVYYALKKGYRLIDGAATYGNEKELGDGVKKAIDEGVVKREDIFITSKLWNTHHKKEHVRPAIDRTLSDLKVKYVDLYLMHFPISLEYVDPKEKYPAEWWRDSERKVPLKEAKVTIRETWEAMEELVDAGLARNIGISNFNAALIMDLLKYARIKPSVLQIEHHPYLIQQRLIDYARSQDLAITGYSSFGARSYIDYGTSSSKNAPVLLKESIVEEIAKKHNKSVAQVLLRWTFQHKIAILPKSSNEARITENGNITDFNLTDEEIKKINSLDRNLRFNDPGFPIFA